MKRTTGWRGCRLQKRYKRLVTPAIHAAISKRWGDFSAFAEDTNAKAGEGRLIYAGGDDVCAVMPVSTVVMAAREISRYYTSAFKLTGGGIPVDISERAMEPEAGQAFSINLGKNDDAISISARHPDLSSQENWGR